MEAHTVSRDSSIGRAARLTKITHLLYRNPRGLTAREMAGLCQVTPRTVQRDLQVLEEAGVPLWEDEDGRRYGILEGYFLPPIRLGLHEAMALFVAARLLSRYSDEHNPHITSALAKLAGILPEAMAGHVLKTARTLAQRAEDPLFTQVMETLTLGWATGRKVRLRYQSAGSENVHEYVFCPYFIEPSGVGYATYVIGHSSYFDGMRTFKVERIQKAELLQETFEIPEDFDAPELLAASWGIIYGEEEITVKLRFSPEVTRRVKESTWHPSQEIEDQPDGGCLFTVAVANPIEITPWIRSWGAECEVLEPANLREEIGEEMTRGARLYAAMTAADE
jgi:predicted DNA-binding transcriptional regulator YafY